MLEENYKAKSMVGEIAADVVEAFHKTGIASTLDACADVVYWVGTAIIISPKASLGPDVVRTLKQLGFVWLKNAQDYRRVSQWYLRLDIHDRGIVQPRKRCIQVELDRECAEEIFEMLYEGESERQREGQ